MTSPDEARPIIANGSRVGRRSFLLGAVASAAGLVAACDTDGGTSSTTSTPPTDGSPSTPSNTVGPSSSTTIAPTTSTAPPVSTFSAPEAAYVRQWGLTGAGPCSPIGDQECATGQETGLRTLIGGLSVPGLGIPLGGVGAGSFHYNLFGTFGPWNMGGSQSSNFWEMRTLPAGRVPRPGGTGRRDGRADGQDARHATRQHRPSAELRRGAASLEPAGSRRRHLRCALPVRLDHLHTCSDRTSRCGSGRRSSPARTSGPRCRWPSSIVQLTNPTDSDIDLSVMFTFPNATLAFDGHDTRRSVQPVRQR